MTCLISLTAFDTVGIDRSLCEESVCSLLTYLAPENIIEFSADYLTLLLRIGNSL